MSFDSYTSEKHTHNFAIWAACRAAQRGCKGFTITAFERAFVSSGVRDELNCKKSIKSRIEFDDAHKNWCVNFKDCISTNSPTCTDGRAAKAVNMYLKVRQMNTSLDRNRDTSFWHPPIDAILLKNLQISQFSGRNNWTKSRWTQMNYDEYFGIIRSLRSGLNGLPMWKIEQYWKASI